MSCFFVLILCFFVFAVLGCLRLCVFLSFSVCAHSFLFLLHDLYRLETLQICIPSKVNGEVCLSMHKAFQVCLQHAILDRIDFPSTSHIKEGKPSLEELSEHANSTWKSVRIYISLYIYLLLIRLSPCVCLFFCVHFTVSVIFFPHTIHPPVM